MMNDLYQLSEYKKTHWVEINPAQAIETKKRDFQWKLRNAIEREKETRIKRIRTEYRNSKEHKWKEYVMFCNSLQHYKSRLSNETKEFASIASNDVYRSTGLTLPQIDMFPEGYASFEQEANLPQATTSIDFSPQITSVDEMDGHEFEYWCADLLRENGFQNVTVTPGSGDQGVDLLAEKDGVRYAIQCKRFSSPLGNTPVQEVHTGKEIYNCHIGVVMTNSTFTSGAIDAATRTNTMLWDRSVLEKMLKNTNSSHAKTRAPSCPQCGKVLIGNELFCTQCGTRIHKL